MQFIIRGENGFRRTLFSSEYHVYINTSPLNCRSSYAFPHSCFISSIEINPELINNETLVSQATSSFVGCTSLANFTSEHVLFYVAISVGERTTSCLQVCQPSP